MCRVHPLGYLTKTTANKRDLQSANRSKCQRLSRGVSELEETVGEKTVDEPFSQRVFSRIYILYIHMYRYIDL